MVWNNTEMVVVVVGGLHSHPVTAVVFYYCELNWSGTQEEEEFEMRRADEGPGEGRDKGWEA